MNKEKNTGIFGVGNGRTYDYAKAMALVWFPAIGTLYFTLGGLWGWPNVEQVLGTIVAVEVFFGAVLGLSKKQYNKTAFDGSLVIDESDPLTDKYNLAMEVPLEDLKSRKSVKLDIQKRETDDPPLTQL